MSLDIQELLPFDCLNNNKKVLHSFDGEYLFIVEFVSIFTASNHTVCKLK